MSDTANEPAEDFAAGNEPAQPRVRKRGRPAKEAAALGTDAAHEAPEAAATDNEPKRRRGRPVKSEKVDALARQVFGFHQMVAVLTQIPMLAIAENEAKALATSGLEVANEFDLEVGGKYATVVTFIATIGMIYVPRAVMISRHLAQAKSAARQAPPEPRPVYNNAPIDPERHPFEDMPKVTPERTVN